MWRTISSSQSSSSPSSRHDKQLHRPDASFDDIGITCDIKPSGFGKAQSTLVCFLKLAHLK